MSGGTKGQWGGTAAPPVTKTLYTSTTTVIYTVDLFQYKVSGGLSEFVARVRPASEHFLASVVKFKSNTYLYTKQTYGLKSQKMSLFIYLNVSQDIGPRLFWKQGLYLKFAK